MASKLLHSTAAKFEHTPAIDHGRDLPMSIRGAFSVATVGDIVQVRALSNREDPGVAEALTPVRQADFAIGNLEQTIADRRTFTGGAYGVPSFLIMAPPAVATDLAAMGFSMLNRANNRLSDFGVEGSRETDRHLREAGITPFGFGEHLAEARAAAFVDVPKGRIGAVGVTANVAHNLEAGFAAGRRIGLAGGRPGANHMRVTRTIHLPPEDWLALRKIALERDYAFPGGFPIVPNVEVFEDKFRLGIEWYAADETPGYSYTANEDDVLDLLREVRNAALSSDFCCLSVHTHQWMIDSVDPRGGLLGEVPEPPQFLVELADRAVAEGADMVCFHGPFEFRAVQILRGKPIFYGLGSFVRHAYLNDIVPSDILAARELASGRQAGIDLASTREADIEIVLARTARHPARYFEGATAVCDYHDGQLRQIRLYPIDLGFNGPIADLGTPRAAQREQGARILAEIAERSDRFGMTLIVENGVGIIRNDHGSGETG